jgi:C4-type Zn-finger protein
MRYHILQKVDLEKAEVIDQFLLKLRSVGLGEVTFTFILDDPAGNTGIICSLVSPRQHTGHFPNCTTILVNFN